MFKKLEDSLNWLETQLKFKPKSDLNRMKEAFRLFSLDLSNIKKIHIAGTNGKGSVASFTSHILMEAGYKVGTYTSPYLVHFNERIMINFKEINDDHLYKLIEEIYHFNITFEQSYGEALSFFELLTLMALIYFYNQKVDVIVMEVGLGGLFDATNILNYDLSLITSIGFDHMKQLGNTLESIAFNKLGILKENNTFITTVDPNLHHYFNQYDYPKGVKKTMITLKDIDVLKLDPMTLRYKNHTYELSLTGQYQILNSVLAIEAIFQGFDIDVKTIQKGLKKAFWPARMEIISQNPIIYLDAAHNTHAVESLVETLKQLTNNPKIYILFSALGDKDIKGMLNLFQTLTDHIMITRFPDLRFIDFDSQIKETYEYIEDPFDALNKIKHKANAKDIIVISGSLHFVGYMKKNLV